MTSTQTSTQTSTPTQEVKEEDVLKFLCPHCEDEIEVLKREINCGIFRHAIFKVPPHSAANQPHAPEVVCQKAVLEGSVHGCAKPFELIKRNNTWEIAVCEYR